MLEQRQPHATVFGGDLRQPEAEGFGQLALRLQGRQQGVEVVVEEGALQRQQLFADEFVQRAQQGTQLGRLRLKQHGSPPVLQ